MSLRLNVSTLNFIGILSFLPILFLSKNGFADGWLLAALALCIQTGLWIYFSKYSLQDDSTLKAHIIYSLLLVLPFSLLFSTTFIQALWDSFLSSNGLNPYLHLMDDEEIGLGKTSLLYSLNQNHNYYSSVSPALQILMKPVYLLYSKTNLLTALVSFKIVMITFFAFILNKFRNEWNLSEWIFNPIIWIFGISQANPEFIGVLLFLWGYFYFMKDETQTAMAIWGISSLFGILYVFAAIYLIEKHQAIRFTWISIISAGVWLLFIWDSSGFYHYAFLSNWHESPLFLFLSQFAELSTVIYSGLTIIFVSLLFAITLKIKTNTLFLFFLLIISLCFPLSFHTVWGLLLIGFLFFDELTEKRANLVYQQVGFIIYCCFIVYSKAIG